MTPSKNIQVDLAKCEFDTKATLFLICSTYSIKLHYGSLQGIIGFTSHHQQKTSYAHRNLMHIIDINDIINHQLHEY